MNRHYLSGVWIRLPGLDMTLLRIGTEFSVRGHVGDVEGEYSGPIIGDFGPITEDAVEVILIDSSGNYRGRGKALVDMSWSQWGVRGNFRSSEMWQDLVK